jgi:hypothetical protein
MCVGSDTVSTYGAGSALGYAALRTREATILIGVVTRLAVMTGGRALVRTVDRLAHRLGSGGR